MAHQVKLTQVAETLNKPMGFKSHFKEERDRIGQLGMFREEIPKLEILAK